MWNGCCTAYTLAFASGRSPAKSRRKACSERRPSSPLAHHGDALAIQKRIPASLIFVPGRGGLSHNPREFTDPEALDKGCAVLVETLWRMATAES
nr:M20/M25/M40 family metallo-hydrolase [Bradyrhizobium sp. AUGA SZCCT0042]